MWPKHHLRERRRLRGESLEQRNLLASDVVFQPPVDYPTTGNSSASVTAADLDGDGDQDLAVADCACGSGNSDLGAVLILLNQGDGTFGAAVRYEAGRHPGHVTVGDIDGDSDLDLAVTGYDSRVVSLLFNNGRGDFSDKDEVRMRTPVRAVIADLNGDGNMDLVSTSGLSRVSVSLGAGTSNGSWLGLHGVEAYSVRYNSRRVSVADFDNDGVTDLGIITRNNSLAGYVEVLLGSGDGTFTLSPKRQFVGQVPTAGHTAGDINGDGLEDLITILNANGGVSIGLNAGVEDGEWTGFERFRSIPPNTPRDVMDVALGDLNADGHLDLMIAQRVGRDVAVRLGVGDGTFREPENWPLVGDGRAVTAVDVDGDGKLDMVGASDRHVSVFINVSGEDRNAVWDGSQEVGNVGDATSWADPNNWSIDGFADQTPSNEIPGDNVVFGESAQDAIIDLSQERYVNNLEFQADVTLSGHSINVFTESVTVSPDVAATMKSEYANSQDLTKRGDGTLAVNGALENIVVEAGTLAAAGTMRTVHVTDQSTFSPGMELGTAIVERNVTIDAGGALLIEVGETGHDLLEITRDLELEAGTTLRLRATSPLAAVGDSLFNVISVRRFVGEFTNFPSVGQHIGAGVFTVPAFGAPSPVLALDRSIMISLRQTIAGDVNGDGEFNQQDIVQILQAGKYLKVQAAEWTDGDWNGDGSFDQGDIVVALQSDSYLK